MFEKLLSLLPYNPALAHQVSFYGRRMREEASIRRTGMIFMVLAFMVQFFAVLSPPQATSADANTDNNLVSAGVTSAADARQVCENNTRGYQVILHYYGIGCDDVGNGTLTTIHSTAEGNQYFSAGHTPSSPASVDLQADQIPGADTVYWRHLSIYTATSDWPALHVTNNQGKTFYILLSCGNLVSIGLPVHSQFQAPVTTPAPAPAPAPAPSVPPVAPPAPAPIASPTPPIIGVNAPSCSGGITGWGYQPSAGPPYRGSVTVYVYVNSSPNYFAQVQTNTANTSDYPSFSVPIPAAYIDGQAHTYKVYAVGSSAETGPGSNASATTIYGADPTAALTCSPPTPIPTPTPTPTPTPVPTPTPTPTPPPKLCPYDSGLLLTDTNCQVCPYTNTITASNPACKPCDKSTSSTDSLSCLSISKTAANVTAGISDANNTTANAGDVITYTLYADNQGKADIPGFSFQENLSDVAVYADITDLHGGVLDSNNVATWPGQTIPAGQTVSVQVTVKVKDPIPQTPANPNDPYQFDLTMTNVYGNTVNIKLPATPVKNIETVAATLPNTGPGTGLFLAAALVIIGGYFYARARLLAKESNLALRESSGA